MDNNGHNDRPWILDHGYTNSHTDQTGAEYCPPLLSAYYSGLSGGHGQGLNSTGVTSTTYPGASAAPGPSFHTPSCSKIYEEGSSSHFNQHGSAYAIRPQVLYYDYTSQMPATVGEKVLCDSGGDQDTCAYPASAPAKQWDTRAPVPRPTFCPASIMQPPCVIPSPPKNKCAVTSASPAICDTRWNQDMGTYPAYSQRDAQLEPLGPIPNNTGDKLPTGVAPSLFEDEAAGIAFTISTPKGPTHNTGKCCPICRAPLGRSQDRKRHILSHLPHWLQCQAPGCSWRGDRWEHLRKHRSKVHLSSSQEPDTHGSIIYDPWPLVKGITNNSTTYENAKVTAISLVEEKANELNKLGLWGDFWGRRRRKTRRSRRAHSPLGD